MTDKKLAAVCGLFCPACSVYIGSQEEPERLKGIAERYQATVEEFSCDGCRAENRCSYCMSCKMVSCAAEKGVDFCGECEQYPCEDIKAFQEEYPHRIELWTSQERIKEVGYEQWFREMNVHYACSQCSTINSAYDLSCRKCGATPGSPFADLHKEAVSEFQAKRK